MARSIVLAGLSYASAALVGAAALTAAACGSGSSPPRAHRPVRLGEEPYWVAGGKLIAFAGSRSDFPLPLRVMDSHGSHRRTVARNASTATLAPSGRTVAEITGDGRRLVLRTVTGKQLRTFRIPYAPDQRPIWAPAEQAVAIEAIKGIVVADLRGGVRLIHEGRGAPAWSPDGRWIAFWDALDNMMVMRRDGTHLTRVAGGAQSPPTWSPDGQRLAFARHEGIYVVRPDGSGLRRVAAALEGGFEPVWSPDGQRLAYVGSPVMAQAFGGYGPAGIYVVSVGGGRAHRITIGKGGQYSVSWAPAERILWSRLEIIWTGLPGSQPVAIG